MMTKNDKTCVPDGAVQPAPWGRMLRVLLICSLTACLVGLWLLADLYQDYRNQGVRMIEPDACDLHQAPCTAKRGGQSIELAIESAQIGSHGPLDLRVRLAGIDARQVVVELQGRDMYMGLNRVELQHQPDGSYRARTQLPVCTTGEMTWRAQVLINPATEPLGTWFDFSAG